jgi:ADP-heptose:LPS heptosyltransferase
MLHVAERVLARRERAEALSFGESLDTTRDILLVAARELPDLLAIVPAARALRKRFRLARVHVLSSKPCAEILSGRPEIFEIVPWDPSREAILSSSFVRRLFYLRSKPFDLSIATDGGDRRLARLVAVVSGAKLRVGIHPEGVDPTLNLVVAAPLLEGYRPVQSLDFLSFLGIPREELAPSWEVPEADRQYAQRFLRLRRKGEEGFLLGVDPGPGRSGVRPAPDRLAWLTERVMASRGALPIIITEDRDSPCVEEFRAALRIKPLEASSRGLRDDLAFASCCDLFMSANTNLFHFAVALGIPTIGLFAPEEADRWVPPAKTQSTVLRLKPGDLLRERDFLQKVDQVRRAKMSEFPLRLSLDEPPPPLPSPEERETSRR